ncbi:cell wall / vacuolar inhibitor of fructosidase 2-like [Corylus avellana]|uniref:cell wall / vacuolar inhibitor of fructosidase 2-like n=1 Tax=Corylus avellana TaxID=13451 RepID=UPI00286C7BE7|nr:cell wall / vacuolar inhibitor of fructosidase 2-like [Corylus avellana]XP_059436083.1 cell wall / vacuolar inhibitor of fructosidase 2-like [Corylus avellana]
MKSLLLAGLLVFSQFSGILRADLVDDVCMRTDFPAICTSTLRSNPGSASADVKGLARIMLPVASEPVLKAMLKDCTNDYGVSVVSSCLDAIQKFDMGIFRIAQGNMEDIAGGAESCKEVFSCVEVGYSRKNLLPAMAIAVNG